MDGFTAIGPSGGKRINVHFRVAFFTKWGQSLRLVGSGAVDWRTVDSAERPGAPEGRGDGMQNNLRMGR